MIDKEMDNIDKLKATAKQSSNPLKSIRAHCIECMGGSPQTVRECVSVQCALHDFRLGKNPRRKKSASTNNGDALRKWRENNNV